MRLEDMPDNVDNDEQKLVAELNESTGVVKWQHVPFFEIPDGNWKIGSTWDRAYYDTAEYVILAVVGGRLYPKVHGVAGMFLFRHFVELELKYILFHSRWLSDSQTNIKETVEEIDRIHYLDRLWAAVKTEAPPKFGNPAWTDFDIAFIDEVVKELNTVDPNSYGFRYNGKVFGVGEQSADPEVSIDYQAILDQMEHVYNVLHSMKVILIEAHGLNAAWEAEMESW